MNRFALLYHTTTLSHYDLLIEVKKGAPLVTFSFLPDGLEEIKNNNAVTMNRLDDHRNIYLDYEGPLSDGRGSVTAYDRGIVEEYSDNGTVCTCILRGAVIDGKCRIQHLKGNKYLLYFSKKK